MTTTFRTAQDPNTLEPTDTMQVMSVNTKKKKELKLVNGTTKEDIELFNRLLKNRGRCSPQNIPSKAGVNNATDVLETLIDFEMQPQYAISNGQESKTAFQYIGKRIIKTKKSNNPLMPEKKTTEIIWNIQPSEFMQWDIDNSINLPERKVVKKEPWEEIGVTEGEYNRRKLEARLEDIQRVNPDAITSLLDLVNTGKLDKLIKLAESL